MTDPHALHHEILKTVELWQSQAEALNGRKVRVVSKYNGQPYGHSKPPLTGQVHTIVNACVCDYSGLIFFLEGYEYGCPALTLDEVEFLEAA